MDENLILVRQDCSSFECKGPLQGHPCDHLEERGAWHCRELDKLDVISWEHSKVTIWTISSPPALVYHLDPGDDFVRIKGNFGIISYKSQKSFDIIQR